MKMIPRMFLIFSVGFFLASCQPDLNVTSYNGANSITLSLNKDGELLYCLAIENDTLINWSKMGVLTGEDKYSFDKGLTFVKKDEREIDETYMLPTGKRSVYTNFAIEKEFVFTNKEGEIMTVVCRAYDDGIAFRYKLHNSQAVTIRKELTSVSLFSGTNTWMMDWRRNYEEFFPKRIIDTITAPERFLFPVLMTIKNNWMLMTEAEVYDLPAMHLSKPPVSSTLEMQYAEEDSTFNVGHDFVSSWKAFIMGKNLATVVESSLVENLNTASTIENQSWITPGVAVFPWWGNHQANSYIDTLKMYVDLASEMKWEWLEFDVALINSSYSVSKEWENVSWIPELTKYAKERGIKVYGWDDINTLNNKKGRDYVFGRYKELGIDGIKIDYIDSDSQNAMRFRDTVCAEASKRQLMVSFHGETLPRGHRRKYPNIMTHEAVRGAEYYTLYGTPPNPRLNCTLPFTRNVVGPMDYTPVTFTIRPENPRTSTYAHELALAYAFESGWVCMADRPKAYLESPARPILEKIEATWDEIHFIDGYPGEFFVVGRRKADKWFVAGLNGDSARKVKFSLDFIKQPVNKVIIYTDDEKEPMTSIVIRELSLNETSKEIELDLCENGGFVIDVE